MNKNGVLKFEVMNPMSKKNLMRIGHGHVYKDNKISAYEEALYYTIQNAMREQKWSCSTKSIHVHVTYDAQRDKMAVEVREAAHMPKATKKDLGNLLDVLLDVMEGRAGVGRSGWKAGVYRNDSAVQSIIMETVEDL